MIRLFILTYKRPQSLHRNLESLFASDFSGEVFIINNHSSFQLSPEFTSKVKVLHNVLRPDWSTGNMARNWNQALLLGFENLNSPAVPYVMHVQDDILWRPNWCQYVLNLHKQYNFITFGGGDQFVSYTPEAVKKIGIWDERFCGLGYQEGDYFLRALIYNRDKSTINDVGHVRLLNPVDGNLQWGEHNCRHGNHNVIHIPFRDDECELSRGNHDSYVTELLKKVWIAKWGDIDDTRWSESLINNPPRPSIPTHWTYPYFEDAIENLADKGYL